MKYVLLLRHANAADAADDFSRALTNRGIHQAERIGKWMAQHSVVPDMVICSSAVRAKQTAELCTKAAGYQGKILLSDALYDSHEGVYIDTLRVLGNTISSVMLVGHNPEISGFTELLTGKSVPILNAALVSISLPIKHWIDLEEGAGSFDWIQLPP